MKVGEFMPMGHHFPVLTAEEAAEMIPNGAMVAVGGFTPAGSPKAVPRRLRIGPGISTMLANRSRSGF